MKVLLAVDDSEFSKAATEMLINEIKSENTEVHIFHVVESIKPMPPTYSFGMGDTFAADFTSIIQEWRSQGEAIVSRTAKALQAAGFTTKTIIREGDGCAHRFCSSVPGRLRAEDVAPDHDRVA
jgi:nucleotide-binding universal stress UspA family protein